MNDCMTLVQDHVSRLHGNIVRFAIMIIHFRWPRLPYQPIQCTTTRRYNVFAQYYKVIPYSRAYTQIITL